MQQGEHHLIPYRRRALSSPLRRSTWSLDPCPLKISHRIRSHLGHFVLTNALLPLMKTTAQMDGTDVRIVNVGLSRHILPLHFRV